MEITYPISSSRFLLAMQVYARKMASYETYEEVKKREFERISLFRPLPTVSKESIKTEVVEESPRYLLDTEGSEDETVELESLFEGFDKIQDSDWLTSMKSKEEVENRDDEEEQDPLRGVSFASLGLSSSSSDDEQELELREFEVDPSEDEDEISDPLSNSPKSSLSNFGLGVDKLSTLDENSNLSQSETSESNLESEPTRVEFKEEIFRSDYVGKREPWTYVAKEKEVVKPQQPQPQPRVSAPEVAPRKVQEPKPTPRPQVVSSPQPKSVVKPQSVVQRPQIKPQTQTQPQAQDKTVRMVNEDFVSYCRRNLRVQEQVALGYFSPSEIESAVRQGKVLRKGGVLIFAHS